MTMPSARLVSARFCSMWVGDMSTVPLCVHHSLEGEHVHALRSRERGCFLVVQTLWVEKIQSTTDAGSLNTFGRNEIEVAPISSALLRIACLVILYKTCKLACSGPRTRSRWVYQESLHQNLLKMMTRMVLRGLTFRSRILSANR